MSVSRFRRRLKCACRNAGESTSGTSPLKRYPYLGSVSIQLYRPRRTFSQAEIWEEQVVIFREVSDQSTLVAPFLGEYSPSASTSLRRRSNVFGGNQDSLHHDLEVSLGWV